MIKTVGELIEELTKYPSDRPVYVSRGQASYDVIAVDGQDPGMVWIEAS